MVTDIQSGFRAHDRGEGSVIVANELKTTDLFAVSSYKDSLTPLLLASGRKTENLQVVFADTGNGRPVTYEPVDCLEKPVEIPPPPLGEAPEFKTTNIVSVSGGKDSTATLLLAIERLVDNLQAVFADTGNEHPLTYEYIDYLEQTLGIAIRRVKADFTEQITKKRMYMLANWGADIYERRVADGMSHDQAAEESYRKLITATAVMKPSGNPYMDMCLWKTRFPSRKGQFCTSELKTKPINEQVLMPAVDEFDRIVSWQGIRHDESIGRANALMDETVFEDEDGRGGGLFIHRPIIHWSANDVFEFHKKMGVKWNPLYEQGMGRVGCMPCINCTKMELREIANRFPEEIDRIHDWERTLSDVSKNDFSTFFHTGGIDYTASDAHYTTHGVHASVKWARTPKGGKQNPDQIPLLPIEDESDEPVACYSIYGLCE